MTEPAGPDGSDERATESPPDGSNTPRGVIVVGASAGGIAALADLLQALPLDLQACVLVVLHGPPDGRRGLARVLGRATPLPVTFAEHGEVLRRGRILLASPGQHILVHGKAVHLSAAAKENGHRPAIDPLFRSAARWCGSTAMAVVLSGVLDDGAAGAAVVAGCGGHVVVQDPDEALFGQMPRMAKAAVPDAAVLPAQEMGAHLAALLLYMSPSASAGDSPPSHALVLECALTDDGSTDARDLDLDSAQLGEPSGVSCPECHGAMNRVVDGLAVRYRCHVGHAYGPLSLLQAQDGAAEAALWAAVAGIEEQAAVHRDLSSLPSGPHDAAEHSRRADELVAEARRMRQQLRARSDAGLHGVPPV